MFVTILGQWRLCGLELKTGLLLALRTYAPVQVARTLCIRAAGLVRVLTRTMHVHLKLLHMCAYMAIIDACPNINHGTMLAQPTCVPQATLPGVIRGLKMRTVLRA